MSHLLLFLVVFSFATQAYSNLVGIDFGSDSYKVVLAPGAGRKQMQLVFNDGSARKTTTVIGFRNNERLFDSEAVSQSKFKPENIYFHLRDLLGRKDAATAKARIQKYVDYAHKIINPQVLDKKNNTVDYPYLAIQHDSNTVYAVHELVAMIFAQAKRIAEKQDGGRIVDCAVTVPVFWTEDERQSLIDAASLGGLKVLSLIDQGSAIATQYATEQTLEGPDSKRTVVFVDFGESSLQLTMAHYFQSTDEKAKKDANATVTQILGSSWDAELGGRDFTNVLVNHYVEQLRSQIPNIDDKPRVRTKLRSALRKARETLSANKEVQVSIPNLDGDFDFETIVTRQLFENLSKDLLARIAPVFETLFKVTGKSKDDIYAFEMLGGTGRIPIVQDTIRQYLGKEVLDRHMNGDESAAFGATFFGASHSGRYRAAKYKVKDIVHRNVTGTITTSDVQVITEGTEDAESEPKTTTKNVTVVVRGSRVNLKKTLSFHTMEPFTFEMRYIEAENDPLRIINGYTFIDLYSFEGIPANGTETVTVETNATDSNNADGEAAEKSEEEKAEEPVPPKKTKKGKKGGEPRAFYNMTAVPKVFIKLELVDGGMISVSAYVEVYHSEQVTSRVKKNETNTTTEAAPTSEGENKEEEDDEEEQPVEGEKTDGEDEAKAEDDKEEEENTEEKAEEKEEEEYETITQWVSKKEEIPLKIKRKWGPLPSFLKKRSKDVIAELDKAEKQRIKLQESKNELETKIYAVRNAIDEAELKSVTTDEQRRELAELLSELAEWVEYESQSADLLDIREKKNSLDKLVKPIYLRITEKEALPRELESCFSLILAATNVTSNLTNTHEVKESDIEELNKIIESVKEFLDTKKKEQSELEPSDEPILTSEAVKKECDKVVHRVGSLLKKPRKKPAKVKKEKPTTAENTETENTEPKSEEPKSEEPKYEEEPQEQQEQHEQQQHADKKEKSDL